MNISENGMLIKTHDNVLPLDLEMDIVIANRDSTMSIPVKLNKFIISPDYNDSIGVEILNPPEEFLDFVRSFSI